MSNRLRICFLVLGPGYFPVGGLKVIYEYANRLSRRGHKIIIVHAASNEPDASFPRKLRLAMGYGYRKLTRTYGPDSWFQLDNSVELRLVPDLSERHIPDGDILIATAWQTAERTARYQRRGVSRFYLIQHLELWSGTKESVYATWKTPLKKIVIARWLKEIAEDLGTDATYIPNGLDFGVFGMDQSLEERKPATVAMLYHNYEWKGSNDGIEALRIVREHIPELSATLFGVPSRPPNLPEWCEYVSRADQSQLREIFNRSAIFVAPSWTEGWGLPATEAMMCGAALVATDIGGHREFAFHNETALLSPPRNPVELADNILRLIHDSLLRTRLANAGNKYIRRFTWDRAVDSIEQLLISEVQKGALVDPS